MIDRLFDTDICVHLIRRRPAKLVNRLQQHGASRVGLSAITVAELFYGAAKSSKPGEAITSLRVFCLPFLIFPFDAQAAQVYGDVRCGLERHGTPIGSLDTLIAAHALALGVTLVTNNQREFSRVEGLSLENWLAE